MLASESDAEKLFTDGLVKLNIELKSRPQKWMKCLLEVRNPIPHPKGLVWKRNFTVVWVYLARLDDGSLMLFYREQEKTRCRISFGGRSELLSSCGWCSWLQYYHLYIQFVDGNGA